MCAISSGLGQPAIKSNKSGNNVADSRKDVVFRELKNSLLYS